MFNSPEGIAALQVLQKLAANNGDNSPTMEELFAKYWEADGQYLTSAQRTLDAWKAIKDIPGEDSLTLKERKALTITNHVVEEMRKWIREHEVTRFGRAPRPATINREIIVLRRVLNWAVDEHQHILPYMPMRVKLEKEHNVQKTKIGTEEDFQKLLAECDPYNKALCLLFFDCGLRRNEGLYLQRFQMDTDANGITTITLHDTKTNEPRTVALTSRTLEALEALPQRGSYFFARQDGKAPIDVRHLYRKFQDAVARSGLKAAPGETIKWHTLRHSFCYVRRTIDRMQEITVMAFTGHKTDSVFRRYGIADTQEVKSAVSLVEARLAAQSKAAAAAKQPLPSSESVENPRIASRKR